jgi:hypothetical protein
LIAPGVGDIEVPAKIDGGAVRIADRPVPVMSHGAVVGNRKNGFRRLPANLIVNHYIYRYLIRIYQPTQHLFSLPLFSIRDATQATWRSIEGR